MVHSRDVVRNVISYMEETRQTGFQELEAEFKFSNDAISSIVESWKRKITDQASGSNNKRPKTAESKLKKGNSLDKENANPNVFLSSDAKSLKTGEILPNTDKEPANVVDIDVGSMKVAELRTHLRERGLDQQGLKRTLQLRLQRALDEEQEAKQNQPDNQKDTQEEGSDDVDMEEPVDETKSSMSSARNSVEVIEEAEVVENLTEYSVVAQDASMEDIFRGNEQNDSIKSSAVDCESTVDNEVEIVEIEHATAPEPEEKESKVDNVKDEPSVSPKKGSVVNKLLKNTSKLFSPSKSKRAETAQNTKSDVMSKGEDGNFIRDTQMQDVRRETPPSTNDDLCPASSGQSNRGSMACDMSVSEIIKEREEKSNGSQASVSSSASGQVPPSSSKSDIRLDKSALLSTPALQPKKAGAPLSSSIAKAKKKQMDEARKARLEKIRNKVAQSQVSSSVKAQPTYSATKTKSHNTPSNDSAEGRKKAIAAKMRQKAIAGNVISTNTTRHLQQVKGTPVQPQKQQHHHQQQSSKVRSPMDTYEMSDRGESDSDSDESDYENNSPKKKIPKWALKQNLIPALERQFLENPNKLDPDEIFHEVSTCDLGAIFDQKKKKYSKRASTGNWTKDRVTASEKLVYKRKMGFQR